MNPDRRQLPTLLQNNEKGLQHLSEMAGAFLMLEEAIQMIALIGMIVIMTAINQALEDM